MTTTRIPRVSRRTLLTAAGAVTVGGTTAAVLRARNASAPVGDLRILTGGTAGVYYEFGRALAEQLRAAAWELNVVTEASRGSIANLQRLSDISSGAAAGPLSVAFVAADAAALAVRGQRPFADAVRVKALARLYDDYLHLVVRADSGITKVTDLAGRRVSIGPPGSGTALIANRVLTLAGVMPGRRRPWDDLGINESVEALDSGRIDAFFWSGGVPTRGVTDLARKLAINLVSLEAEAAAMSTGRPYRVGSVPPGVYGLEAPISTLAVPNLLVTPTAAPPASVQWLTSMLFASRTAIGRQVPSANTLDARTATSVAPVGLHPGAADFFRAQKP